MIEEQGSCNDNFEEVPQKGVKTEALPCFGYVANETGQPCAYTAMVMESLLESKDIHHLPLNLRCREAAQ